MIDTPHQTRALHTYLLHSHELWTVLFLYPNDKNYFVLSIIFDSSFGDVIHSFLQHFIKLPCWAWCATVVVATGEEEAHHPWTSMRWVGRSWGCWAGPQQRTEEERPASTAHSKSLSTITAELLSSGPCFLGKEYGDYLVIIRLK